VRIDAVATAGVACNERGDVFLGRSGQHTLREHRALASPERPEEARPGAGELEHVGYQAEPEVLADLCLEGRRLAGGGRFGDHRKPDVSGFWLEHRVSPC